MIIYLYEKSTHFYVCLITLVALLSCIPQVNTIASIRQSAAHGHTVLLCQTDDIHESFYDLFNQRFMTIATSDCTKRSFTNIAIGSITKPSCVKESFQCVVVIKKSEIARTPSAFLNRFEKFSLTHGDFLKWLLSPAPWPIRLLLETTAHKVCRTQY